MKRKVVLLVVALYSLWAPGQQKTAEDDPHWRQHTVQNAFNEVSAGMRYSWTEKWLARLGDGAAPEIMNCVSAKPFTKKNAETALALVKMSFADPRLIKRDRDRAPTNTLVLLDYLDKHTSDADAKAEINSVRDQLHRQAPAVEPSKN
jgi:hypothetical protein